jgi:hypothetical protein
MKKTFIYFTISASAALFVSACQHHPDISNIVNPDDNNNYVTPPDTIELINTDPCDPDSVYFTNTILPLLNSNCAMVDCHDAITAEDDVQLYDYAHIMEQVSAGNPGNSDLWEAITETDLEDIMPPTDNGGPLSSDQLMAIQTWIQQGAKNNSCSEDCNPADFSFIANIKPIVDLTCGGCHSGSNPSGTILLETYAQINAIALDGSLMSSLHGTDGFDLMPDNSTGLPECYISQFQNWVNAGAPNN